MRCAADLIVPVAVLERYKESTADLNAALIVLCGPQYFYVPVVLDRKQCQGPCYHDSLHSLKTLQLRTHIVIAGHYPLEDVVNLALACSHPGSTITLLDMHPLPMLQCLLGVYSTTLCLMRCARSWRTFTGQAQMRRSGCI